MRLTTHAHLHRCPHCNAATIRALERPPLALEVRTDPIPLDTESEIRALITGRFTYDLVTIAAHQELFRRDQWRITERAWPVLATHKCPGPIPWESVPPLLPATHELPDEPPF